MTTLIVSGGINNNIYPKIGAIMALPDVFDTFVGFGLSCVLIVYLAIKTPFDVVIEKFLYLDSLRRKGLGEFQKGIVEILKYRIGDITFEDFYDKYGKHLVIGAYNLTRKNKCLFGLNETSNMSVLQAVTLATSIPDNLNVISYEGEIYVDISLVNSIPLSILPTPLKTDSLIIYSNTGGFIHDLKQFLKILGIIDTEKNELKSTNWNRIISLSDTMVLDASDPEGFARIIASAYFQAKNFIDTVPHGTCRERT